MSRSTLLWLYMLALGDGRGDLERQGPDPHYRLPVRSPNAAHRVVGYDATAEVSSDSRVPFVIELLKADRQAGARVGR